MRTKLYSQIGYTKHLWIRFGRSIGPNPFRMRKPIHCYSIPNSRLLLPAPPIFEPTIPQIFKMLTFTIISLTNSFHSLSSVFFAIAKVP